MNKGFDIVGLGMAVLDLVSALPRWPEPDEKMNVGEFVFEGGGQVATALAAASRMGAGTAIIGIIGDDFFGNMIREGLKADGVDLTNLVSDPGTRSPFSVCLSDQETGKRTILFTEKVGRGLVISDVPRALIETCRFLHLDGNFTTCAIKAARWAREAGVKIMLDAEKNRPGMDFLLKHVDYVIASERFCREMTSYPDVRDGIRLLAEKVSGFCGVTLGERGFLGVENGEIFKVPAFPVETVDTLGAGDVFHGAFLVALLRGWENRKAARFASAAAALTCRALGGRKGIPTFEEAQTFMESQTR
jgi:sugar/nucleoside kinase (ribokinase family)